VCKDRQPRCVYYASLTSPLYDIKYHFSAASVAEVMAHFAVSSIGFGELSK